MPEATTDTKGIKKLPKWSYIAIGGGVIILYLYYKKRKSENPPESAYTAQSFIPVTGENVAGAGAGGGGISGGGISGENNNALIQAQKENTEFLTNFLKSEAEGRRESEQHHKEEQKELISAITGGGAPGAGQINTGAGSGGGGQGATVTTTPTPPQPVKNPSQGVPGCPAGFPKYNPARGAPGCGSCYRISREKARKAGYVVHGYCDGHEVESR